MFSCRRMELHLTSHTTNINSQWVTDLNVALYYETIRRKHKKHLKTLSWANIFGVVS